MFISNNNSNTKPRSLSGLYHFICLIGFATVLSGLPVWLSTASADTSVRPGWVERYVTSERPQWNEWRNALQPRGEPSTPLTFAVAGETDYRIVIPRQAVRTERRAALELQLWLGKITGAEFVIVSDETSPQSREVSVGNTNRVSEAIQAGTADAGTAGYVIAVENERIYLLGKGASGPLDAAFALLEEDLGVRWYESALRRGGWNELSSLLRNEPWKPAHYRVGKNPSLTAAIVPRIVKPGFARRQLRWEATYSPWAIRNRVNFGFATVYGQEGYASGDLASHTFHKLVPPAKYFETNPEYYSLIDGERRWDQAQLCLSNPEVAEIAAATAIAALKDAGPYQRMVDISAEDWLGNCQCPDCKAIEDETGAYSGLLLHFVNQVAELVEKEVPDGRLTTFAYWQSNLPPTEDISIHPNVTVRYCADFGANFSWPYHSFQDHKLAEQREIFERWRHLSSSVAAWIYPHQYTNYPAPMPSIRAVAENIRYFHQYQAESMYVQQSHYHDYSREPMRFWIFSKLMWDPYLDVEELLLDFIWGYYGDAAPAVLEYHELLWDHCAEYIDFSRERDWIYPIHQERMYDHGFIGKARDIINRAMAMTEDEIIEDRVAALMAGVVYVEAVQLYMQMRQGRIMPDIDHYKAVQNDLQQVCDRLGLRQMAFYEGGGLRNVVWNLENFLGKMDDAREYRIDSSAMPPENWGSWSFRPDPENLGRNEQWYSMEHDNKNQWREIEVPAHWSQTWVGGYLGYGWYRNTFNLPADHEGEALKLYFGGVDEQAWVYVNGKYAGEHTVESESVAGEEVTPGDLWNRPFTITVAPDMLHSGQENQLVIRVLAQSHNGGIHKPVKAWLVEVE